MPDIFRSFDRIRYTIENDYAGYPEKAGLEGWKAAQRLMYDRLYAKNTPETLYRAGELLVHSYQDRSLRLYYLPPGGEALCLRSPGMALRRYEDSLFVTRVLREGLPFARGDQIHALDGLPLCAWRRSAGEFTYGLRPETERYEDYLYYRRSCGCIRQGRRLELPLASFLLPLAEEAPAFSALDGDTVLLRFGDFSSPGAVEAFLAAHGGEIAAASRRIFDLRENRGGEAAAFLPLLPYLLREPMALSALLDHSYISCYTPNNCDRCLALLQPGDPARAPYEENRGRGFLPREDEALLAMDRELAPLGRPRQVILLTDMGCEGAGEEFALAARRAGALLVGRNTMGASDYCDPLLLPLGFGLFLSYPMSKNARVAAGQGIDRQGLEPDIPIPWSPHHLLEDMDLQAALAL